MSKAIKFTNDIYLSASSIIHNRRMLIDILHPIGSLFISMIDTDPSTLYGGHWERKKDVFLLACGDIFPIGSVGGEINHTLTTPEMPFHTHICRNYSHNWNAGITIPAGRSYAVNYGSGAGQWGYASNNIGNSETNAMADSDGAGGNIAHIICLRILQFMYG